MDSGLFLSSRSLSQPDLILPGSLFLIRGHKNSWNHTGIVIKAEAGRIHTIEGNTNDEKSRNGFELVTLDRNYHKQKLDVVQLKLNKL